MEQTSGETECRCCRMKEERDVLREIMIDAIWMARRYAEGGSHCNVVIVNRALDRLEEIGTVPIAIDEALTDPAAWHATSCDHPDYIAPSELNGQSRGERVGAIYARKRIAEMFGLDDDADWSTIVDHVRRGSFGG